METPVSVLCQHRDASLCPQATDVEEEKPRDWGVTASPTADPNPFQVAPLPPGPLSCNFPTGSCLQSGLPPGSGSSLSQERDFFLKMWTILKVFIEFVTTWLLSYVVGF